jgi:hypothetical protein
MKNIILILLTISMSANLFAQNDKYPSKEEDMYYKDRYKYVLFKPLETKFILGFKPEYYEIHEAELNYEPYSPKKYSTPHEKYVNQYLDSIRLNRSRNFKQAFQEIEKEIGKIGGIDKKNILKYDKRDSIEAFIYQSSKYENVHFGESGIWIGYSENNGKDWNYYYTGIVQKQPVFLKYYSQRPLIKEKGKLEIEACLLRQLTEFCHPCPMPDYECVKDGIYVTFNITLIAKDSDGDGLTDIVEDKFHTNKFNYDTDGDGIPDNQDSNPRVNYPHTEKSKIYEAVINREIDWEDKGRGGKLLFKEDSVFVTDSTETILIVTDNKDLMGIHPSKYRIIFMTTEEYQLNANGYKVELNEMQISPLFKVDNRKNTYKLRKRFDTGFFSYLIKKTKEGWKVEIILLGIS